ncbi:MAG: glycoside hydrolase family 25 protein [Firmicutes bacterium]|nr:glycoside hydrolase family 25 protein [Bacillota bacterium]
MSKPRKKTICLLLAALLLLSSCGPAPSSSPTAAPDPHAGEVQVIYGTAGNKWVPRLPDMPVSALLPSDFSREGDFIRYASSDTVSVQGIDVSFYQKTIDWTQVADAGIQFAIIRAGYRGSSEGVLYEDDCFAQNLQGARDAGLAVGLYFFSQAVTPEEATQEAEFVLSLLSGQSLDLPIFFDWEPVTNQESGARTDNLDGETLTDCALAFRNAIEAAGYDAGVYFNRSLGYFSYDLSRLRSMHFWFSGTGGFSDFYYAHGYWQYSYTAAVPGIEGNVDLNLRFVPAANAPAG